MRAQQKIVSLCIATLCLLFQSAAWGGAPHKVEGCFVCLRFSSDRQILASADDKGNVCLWDTDTWKQTQKFSIPDAKIHEIIWDSGNGRLICVGAEEKVDSKEDCEVPVLLSLELAGGRVQELFRSKEQGAILSVQQVRDVNKLVTFERKNNGKDFDQADYRICIRDSRTGVEEAASSIPVVPSCWRISADGKKVAIGSDTGLVLIWDVLARQMVRAWRDKQIVVGVEFSPEGDWVYGSVLRMPEGEPEFCRWKLAAPQKETLQSPVDYYFRDIRFSPNGKWIAVPLQDRGKCTVGLWDGKKFRELEGTTNKFRTVNGSVAWSSDSSKIIVTHAGDLQAWDVPDEMR